MGGKHLKKLRAEKSKIHLKKKKLPKGQNLTSTAFTVKKILPVVQLQKVDKDEPVSNWNVPLKDLLMRLNHYNFTSRLNGLLGIKELITKYPEILRGPALKPLMSKLLELITDEEHKIRVTAIDLLSYLCDLICPSSIIAFQKILHLHLGCAMTHRNSSVQQDSLNLVDVLINYSPEVIRCNFKLITQNFMRIMKSYFYESYAGVFSSGKSKQDLEKAKKEMLLRFYQLIVRGYPTFADAKQQCHHSHKTVNVLLGQTASLRDSIEQYKRIPHLSVFENSESEQKLFGDFNSKDFMSLCSLVIPLLFDTWLEFCPYQRCEENPEVALTEVAGDLLFIILKILLFLYEMAAASEDIEAVHWFTSNYGPGFKMSFTFNFPYVPRFCAKISKSNGSSDFQKGCSAYMLPNLIICYLAYSLKAVDRNSKLETKIENYVSAALMSNQQDVELLLRVTEAGIHASKCGKSSIILNKVVATYSVTQNPELRKSFSKILMNVALEEKSIMDEEIRNWMKSLADRLCGVLVFLEEVETILKLISTSRGQALLREIELKGEEILENLQNVKIEGINQFEGQKKIANILYRCGRDVLIRMMEKKILDKGTYHCDLKNYISDIFSQKLTNHL